MAEETGSRLILKGRAENFRLGLGRHPDGDIFDDATVSRHHAEFLLESGQFLLVDLDSTYVDHEPIDSAVVVDGDEIQIGKFRFVFLTPPTTG